MENTLKYFDHTGFAVTVCDTDCRIVYQNAMSLDVNGDMRNKVMLDCHNERSRAIIRRILSEGISNSYTISKKGKRKIIHQTPWKDSQGIIAGIVELSIVIPEELPHYNR